MLSLSPFLSLHLSVSIVLFHFLSVFNARSNVLQSTPSSFVCCYYVLHRFVQFHLRFLFFRRSSGERYAFRTAIHIESNIFSDLNRLTHTHTHTHICACAGMPALKHGVIKNRMLHRVCRVYGSLS